MIKPFPFIVVRYLAVFLALGVFLGAPAGIIHATETQLREKVKGAVESVVDQAGGVEKVEKKEEHTLPQAAPHLHVIGPLVITDSMVMMWGVAILLIGFAQFATRQIKTIPEGAQNFLEWIVESLYLFLESIIGPALVKRTFWFFASIFIFILASNWFGLIPGVGTFGWGYPDANGNLHHIEIPMLRGVQADLNMTFAMSMIFFICWIYWAITENGVIGFFLHLFGPQGNPKGFLKVIMIPVFLIVGVLEVVSILFRPISLSFRLYGNIFAGENILDSMSHLVPALSWLIPLPFYFMELLVGLVQALVFMLLTAVFTLLICQHSEGHESHH